ncbi:acetylcholine receptor subunit alpha-like [Panulirus ornatus]|uniref:acetylcholine receptor subunit alpha-like n=1 Tax=Panulirus ornatus TaxID=150431 RepID=UPI003A8C886E
MRFFAILLLVCVCLTPGRGKNSVGQTEALTDNWIGRLYEDTMKGYNSRARPVTDPTHNTTVLIALSVNYISMDDVRQELSVTGWSIMSWMDEHLHWEPKNYVNINRLHFDDDDIWMPDITVFNSAEGSNVHPFGAVPVLVISNGQTYWFPPTHMIIKCDLDLTLWPSDQHECVIRMGSWAHHGEQIDIQVMPMNDTDGVMMDNFEENSQWELVKVAATRTVTSLEDHDPYVEINFTFIVKRQARAHAIYITHSTLAILMVVLASYALPLDSFFSRLIMHLFAMGVLIGCYFMLFASLPANGGPIPLVVRYYAGTLILTTISLLATIFLTSCGPYCSSSTNTFSKKLVGVVSATPVLRNVVNQQTYNHLEAEIVEEREGVSTQPSLAEMDDDGHTSLHVRRVVNFLLLLLFTVAFLVDYMVLRSVTV